MFAELREDEINENHTFSVTTVRRNTVDAKALEHKLRNVKIKGRYCIVVFVREVYRLEHAIYSCLWLITHGN